MFTFCDIFCGIHSQTAVHHKCDSYRIHISAFEVFGTEGNVSSRSPGRWSFLLESRAWKRAPEKAKKRHNVMWTRKLKKEWHPDNKGKFQYFGTQDNHESQDNCQRPIQWKLCKLRSSMSPFSQARSMVLWGWWKEVLPWHYFVLIILIPNFNSNFLDRSKSKTYDEITKTLTAPSSAPQFPHLLADLTRPHSCR